MATKETIRVRLIAGSVLLVTLTIITRLFFVQIVHGGEYEELGSRQYVSANSNSFNRGGIFFMTKDAVPVAAAALTYGSILAIHPAQIKGIESTYEALVSILPKLNKDSFTAHANKINDPYEEIATRISDADTERIDALKLPGVGLYRQKWRVYPSGGLAAQTVGLIGFKGNELAGRYGLEEQYEGVLGRSENSTQINFFAEIFTELGNRLTKNSQREGDIYLTIEPTVQGEVEKELVGIKQKYDVDLAGAVVMDPHTGAVRAFASIPSFDPSAEQKDISLLGNPLVERVYEFGSIVKPLTMAAGLDAGVVRPETTYNDKGTITLNSKKISNYDGRGRGVVPMQEVLNQSLNTGAVFVMQSLGKERFRDYFRNYGFGEKTGIDLPGELAGLTDNLESTREVEYATASFGQGIAVTPIAMTRALATLGNGGVLVHPYLVKDIRYKTLEHDTTQTQVVRRVLSQQTSEDITRMLVNVFDKALAGGKFRLDHYSIASKTGTAQMSNPAGGYYSDRYLHSFFGYFPAYDPHYIVFLYIVYPKHVQYASETLSEPFAHIANFLINYYHIPPDR